MSTAVVLALTTCCLSPIGESIDKPILGYYYTLRNDEPTFTDTTQVTFFDLPDGGYSFSVSAVDIDGIVDPTPAFRNFQVSRNIQLEFEFLECLYFVMLLTLYWFEIFYDL